MQLKISQVKQKQIKALLFDHDKENWVAVESKTFSYYYPKILSKKL